MQKQPNSQMCFVCGMENPIGLKMFFYEDDEGRVIARFTPREEHQGYPGVLHGGIAMSLLDEIIGRTLVRYDIWAATAKLEVRFRKPVPIGQEVTVIGEMTNLRRRVMQGHGEIRLADGTVAVEADGVYIRISDEDIKRYQEALAYWKVVPD